MHADRRPSAMKHVTDPPDSQRNFLVVDPKTETPTIEKAFQNFTQERKDIAVVLINQHVRLAPVAAISPGCLMLTVGTGRRTYPQQCRFIHRSIPGSPRDSQQRPPVRPREGQRDEAGATFVRRVRSGRSWLMVYEEGMFGDFQVRPLY